MSLSSKFRGKLPHILRLRNSFSESKSSDSKAFYEPLISDPRSAVESQSSLDVLCDARDTIDGTDLDSDIESFLTTPLDVDKGYHTLDAVFSMPSIQPFKPKISGEPDPLVDLSDGYDSETAGPPLTPTTGTLEDNNELISLELCPALQPIQTCICDVQSRPSNAQSLFQQRSNSPYVTLNLSETTEALGSETNIDSDPEPEESESDVTEMTPPSSPDSDSSPVMTPVTAAFPNHCGVTRHLDPMYSDPFNDINTQSVNPSSTMNEPLPAIDELNNAKFNQLKEPHAYSPKTGRPLLASILEQNNKESCSTNSNSPQGTITVLDDTEHDLAGSVNLHAIPLDPKEPITSILPWKINETIFPVQTTTLGTWTRNIFEKYKENPDQSTTIREIIHRYHVVEWRRYRTRRKGTSLSAPHTRQEYLVIKLQPYDPQAFSSASTSDMTSETLTNLEPRYLQLERLGDTKQVSQWQNYDRHWLNYVKDEGPPIQAKLPIGLLPPQQDPRLVFGKWTPSYWDRVTSLPTWPSSTHGNLRECQIFRGVSRQPDLLDLLLAARAVHLETSFTLFKRQDHWFGKLLSRTLNFKYDVHDDNSAMATDRNKFDRRYVLGTLDPQWVKVPVSRMRHDAVLGLREHCAMQRKKLDDMVTEYKIPMYEEMNAEKKRPNELRKRRPSSKTQSASSILKTTKARMRLPFNSRYYWPLEG
ncbi:hypothetical protein H0H92_000339 [Tricholoma furcatifolium]|nr:hypothetical protein H0H92_000339 [Tricholoma furcatifolium]